MSEASERLYCVLCGNGYDEADGQCPNCVVAKKDTKPERRSLLEIMLEPRTVNTLLGLGGGLLVLGLIVWLAGLGVFENAVTLACCLGAANAAVFGAGWTVLQRTGHRTTGRALTLLACLVMPLNLWFYHAQKLVTLEGHLWLVALAMCAAYAASAVLLADALFVYVLSGGLAMTGLLLLADVGRFAEILAPSTLLVVLGLVALHLERAFPESDGPFSRKRFGMAFFRSSQVLVVAGLALLMGAQVFGWSPLHHQWLGARPVVVEPQYFAWTFALTLAGAYACFYANVVVGRSDASSYVGVAALAWAMLQVLFLQGVAEVHFPTAFALGGLALLVVSRCVGATRGFGKASLDASHVLVALALTASGLTTLAHLAMSDRSLALASATGDWRAPLVTAILAAAAVFAIGAASALATPSRGWRRAFFAILCVNLLVGFATLHRISTLTAWQKVELFSVLAGLALTVAGHVGWAREGEGRNELASFNLSVGALLVAVPLLVATVYHRFAEHRLSMVDETALIAASVAMLASGILFRLRATTLVGGGALAIYVVQMLAWMGRFLHEQVLIGVSLTAGGAVLFGIGLALSVYRERLLALPAKVKNREGLFRILSWR